MVVYLLFIVFCPQSTNASPIENLLAENWFEMDGINFKLISNADGKTIQSIAADLERFNFYLPVIEPELSINNHSPPLTIYLFRDRQSFSYINHCEICTGFFVQTPYQNYIAVNLEDYDNNPNLLNDARRYLYHEYVHYAIRNSINRRHYPLWYEEGLAELLSTFLYNSKVLRIGVMREDMWLIDFDQPFPVKTMFKSDSVPENSREAARYYNYALILYRYFMGSEDNRAQLQKFVNLRNQGYAVDRAFKQAFKSSHAEFGLALDKYLTLVQRSYDQPRFLYLHFKLTEHFTPTPVPAIPLDSATKALSLANLIFNTDADHQPVAAALFALAMAEDSSLVPAYLGMSRHALKRHQPYHALFYLNRALEIVQNAATAEILTLQGDIYLFLAIDKFNQGDEASKGWSVRAFNVYKAALSKTENYLPAHMGLAYYYLLCEHADYGCDISEALISLQHVRAQIEFPTLNFFLARVLMQENRTDEAQKILREIITWHYGDNIANESKTLLGSIADQQTRFEP